MTPAPCTKGPKECCPPVSFHHLMARIPAAPLLALVPDPLRKGDPPGPYPPAPARGNVIEMHQGLPQRFPTV